MPAIRIGINPISWSNDDLPALGGETPLSTALSEGKDIGYEGFELNGKFPKDAKGVGDVLSWAARDATEALAQTASPHFIGGLVVAAICFALLVLHRRNAH